MEYLVSKNQLDLATACFPFTVAFMEEVEHMQHRMHELHAPKATNAEGGCNRELMELLGMSFFGFYTEFILLGVTLLLS
jgi:hypothetical protein